MILHRRLQRSFADGLIADEVSDLWEPWMRHADEVLEDETLLNLVQQELSKRIKKSKTRGRPGTTAEVVLRMLLLKHMRDWSYEVLIREVRANLVYREFTRIGGGTVPDDKTMGRLSRQLGPERIAEIHQRVVAIAQEKKVVSGRKMRVDTTVVETNIHYPTDSSLLGDGVRVLTRSMKRITEIAGAVGTQLRDRKRSVGRRLREIGRASRSRGQQKQEKLKDSYGKLLDATSRVVSQAQRFSEEIAEGVKSSGEVMKQAALEGFKKGLDTMVPRVQQVIRQTRDRIFRGITDSDDKVFSLFEPTTEIIRKGKAGKPNEFGKLVKIQEAENQIITSYEVYEKRPSDSDLLEPAIAEHQRQLDRVPRTVAADAGFFSARNEKTAEQMGVKQVAVPNYSTKSEERKRTQKKRWFRKAQKWRTGCEGRISVLKRRHGLGRCRYKGEAGMERWVGFGVIADSLINIGRVLATRPKTPASG
ncbi:MAG: ISNCY family transposase [bacterium]|nr:ISNCY family transposase [bacterium]